MGDSDVQEIGRAQATGISGRVVLSRITAHGIGIGGESVIGGRASASAQWAPFRVVEDVISLGTEFKARSFPHFEVLVESHVEVGVAGIPQTISAGVTERQALRSRKRAGVAVQRTIAGKWHVGYEGERIADTVGIGTSSDAVTHAGVIGIVRRVRWTIGSSSLRGDYAGIPPTAEKFVRQARILEEGQIVNPPQVEHLADIEARAGSVRRRIVSVNER